MKQCIYIIIYCFIFFKNLFKHFQIKNKIKKILLIIFWLRKIINYTLIQFYFCYIFYNPFSFKAILLVYLCVLFYFEIKLKSNIIFSVSLTLLFWFTMKYFSQYIGAAM
jgi:hypothetical protein